MIRTAIFSLLSIFLIFSGNCAAVEIIPIESQSEYTMSAYDYVNYYSANNPEWNICIVSTDHLFRQNCYYYNYQYDKEGHLLLKSTVKDGYRIVSPSERENTFIHTFENEESVPVIWDYMTDNVLFIR